MFESSCLLAGERACSAMFSCPRCVCMHQPCKHSPGKGLCYTFPIFYMQNSYMLRVKRSKYLLSKQCNNYCTSFLRTMVRFRHICKTAQCTQLHVGEHVLVTSPLEATPSWNGQAPVILLLLSKLIAQRRYTITNGRCLCLKRGAINDKLIDYS